jgi:hypothetical protein
MTRLRVSFLAGGFGISVALPNDETVLGSCIWDTQTNVISHASLTCYGPYKFLPSVTSAHFAPPPVNYPAGSLTFLQFKDAAGNFFQLDYGALAFGSQTPIVPNIPGIYGCQFYLNSAPGSGMVIVTETEDVPNPPVPGPPGGLTVTVE